MDNKIKVALCLSGEPRSSMFCFPYIYEAFLKPNPLFKTDTYIHSWKNFRALDLYNPKNYKIQNTNDDFIGDIINTLNFSPSLQEQLSYYNLHTKSTNFLFNQIKMFYSIKECFNLCYKVNRWDGEVFIKHILDNNNNIKVSQSFINHKVVRQSDVITNKINPNNFLDE